jgi:hypothetical protein
MMKANAWQMKKNLIHPPETLAAKHRKCKEFF